MPVYVMLSRLSPENMKTTAADPTLFLKIRETLEAWEAKVLYEYQLLGIYDHVTIFEAPDNFRAYRAAIQQELLDAAQTQVFPAIDLPLFQRMVSQEIRTEGPHEWQQKWWAKLGRLAFRWHAYGRWVSQYCKPLSVTGLENFRGFKGNCIVVANHTSHFDSLVLQGSLPQRIKWNIYFGAAADRWFLKGGGGKKELVMQPWYQSLAVGSFPIQRGGGSRTLAYSKWLLDQGANLMIFPEGTRSTSRKLSRFKHGVSILALEKQVPVVPVYLTGVANLRPKGTREIQPGPAGAHIQPPVFLEPGMSVPDATRAIYDAVNHVHQRVMIHGDEAAPWDSVYASMDLPDDDTAG